MATTARSCAAVRMVLIVTTLMESVVVLQDGWGLFVMKVCR